MELEHVFIDIGWLRLDKRAVRDMTAVKRAMTMGAPGSNKSVKPPSDSFSDEAVVRVVKQHVRIGFRGSCPLQYVPS